MARRIKRRTKTTAKRPTRSKAPQKSKAKISPKARRKAKAPTRSKQAVTASSPSSSRPKPPPRVRRGSRPRQGTPQPRPSPGRPLRPGKLAANPYETDLDRTPANYQPLTPVTFLQRAAAVHPEIVAIIHGKGRINYAEFYTRSRRLASALAREGVGKGDTVSVLLANTPAMLEAHHGVPMTGGVLNALNTRLD